VALVLLALDGLALPRAFSPPVRLAMWDLEHIREFTESRPEFRAKLLQTMSGDLAAKLYKTLTVERVGSV
jgi:hypothetical protein